MLNVGPALDVGHLLGRDQEIATLKKAFDEAKLGSVRFLLIEGESGVGKSSLVTAIRNYIKENGGLYIAGKFDLNNRNVPYNALIHGLSNYLDSEVLPDQARISELQDRLRRALGNNAPLIARLIPMLSKVIDNKDERALSAVNERRDRLSATLQNCLEALSTPGSPVVLFLDDLQWADAASRQLAFNLLTAVKSNGLLIIATLRTSEMSDLNPVRRLLTDLAQARVRYKRVPLGNLSLDNIRSLVSSHLGAKHDFSDDLAQLIFAKTHGNPFFMQQFYRCLVQEGALSGANSTWAYNPLIAKQIQATDNVFDLITHGVSSLSPETQAVLCLGSCFGNRFFPIELMLVGGWSHNVVQGALKEAQDAGLISTAKGQYNFTHDRIFEAIYEISPLETRSLNHYKIASAMVRTITENATQRNTNSEADFDKMSFFLARQYKAGTQHVRTVDERVIIAKINLAAARRAKESLLYDAANSHVDAALEILPEVNWTAFGDLLHALYLIKAESLAYTSETNEGDEIFDYLLRNIKDPAKLSEIHQLAMGIKISFGHYEEGVKIGIRGLQALGVQVKENPSWLDFQLVLRQIHRRLRSKSLASLENLPQAHASLADKLAMAISSNAYFYNSRMISLMTMQACLRTLHQGTFDGSWSSLSFYAANIASRFARYREAAVIGEIAMKACQTVTPAEKGLTNFVVPAFIQVWTRPLKPVLDQLNANFEFCKDSGQTASAMSSALMSGSYGVFSGQPLSLMSAKVDSLLKYMLQHRSYSLHDSLLSSSLAVKALRGETLTPGSFSTPELSEEVFVKRLQAYPSKNAYAWYGSRRFLVDYLLCDYEKAAQSFELARSFSDALPYSYGTMIQQALETLYFAVIYPKAGIGKLKVRLKMKSSLRKLRRLAAISPGELQVLYLLAQAEYDRISGRHDRAADHYTEAIVNARQHELIHWEALGEELIARFKIHIEVKDEAVTHFNRAYVLYSNWGATAKAEQLKSSAKLDATPNFQHSGEIVFLS